MFTRDIIELLRKIGCRKISRSGKNKVISDCPFAEWTHNRGTDIHPSFVVWQNEIGNSSYFCAACGKKGGSLFKLVKEYGYESGKRVNELLDFIRNRENGLEFNNRYRVDYNLIENSIKMLDYNNKWVVKESNADRDTKEENENIIDENKYIRMYENYKGNNCNFFKERGIEERSVKEWDLGYDIETKRVLFPVKNSKGQVVGISGRFYGDRCVCGLSFSNWNGDNRCPNPNCRRYKPAKYLHSLGLKKNLVLYGEDKIDKNFTNGYVVEGTIDAIKLWQIGYRNPVAIMGSKPSKQQIDKLISFFTRLVIVPDSDKSGHEMYKILRSKFDKKIPFVFKQLPNGSDPGDLKKEDIIKILGRPEIIENVDITDFD